MDRKELQWQMTAEQFAAFDVQLYLDTHPNDTMALQLLNKYQGNHEELKKQFEMLYGPISSHNTSMSDRWMWIDNPWPWEMEAN